jgi:hypothetical protein
MTLERWQYENEREWQRYVVQLARSRGWSVFHVPDSRRTTPGWPDLALLRAPDFLLVELKTNNGRLSRNQQTTIDALEACHVEVHVWRPQDEDAVRERLARPKPRHGDTNDWRNQ